MTQIPADPSHFADLSVRQWADLAQDMAISSVRAATQLAHHTDSAIGHSLSVACLVRGTHVRDAKDAADLAISLHALADLVDADFKAPSVDRGQM